jgi:predicted RNA methylase
LQQTIRALAEKAGFLFEPLPMEGKMAECCNYGGNVAVAHPPYTHNMIRNRIRQNDLPFITYCSNCRDIFAPAGDLQNMDYFLSLIKTHGFTVTAMVFQDAGNIDLARLRRCSFHVYDQGRHVPFCAYYLTPWSRE